MIYSFSILLHKETTKSHLYSSTKLDYNEETNSTIMKIISFNVTESTSPFKNKMIMQPTAWIGTCTVPNYQDSREETNSTIMRIINFNVIETVNSFKNKMIMQSTAQIWTCMMSNYQNSSLASFSTKKPKSYVYCNAKLDYDENFSRPIQYWAEPEFQYKKFYIRIKL